MEGCISRYVAFHATPQMGQRSSKMVQLFFAEALSMHVFICACKADRAHRRRALVPLLKYGSGFETPTSNLSVIALFS
jgi:hypothetical protein